MEGFESFLKALLSSTLWMIQAIKRNKYNQNVKATGLRDTVSSYQDLYLQQGPKPSKPPPPPRPRPRPNPGPRPRPGRSLASNILIF